MLVKDLYYDKYLKYKNKYLNLQTQIGGARKSIVFMTMNPVNDIIHDASYFQEFVYYINIHITRNPNQFLENTDYINHDFFNGSQFNGQPFHIKVSYKYTDKSDLREFDITFNIKENKVHLYKKEHPIYDYVGNNYICSIKINPVKSDTADNAVYILTNSTQTIALSNDKPILRLYMTSQQ
jgi:hypothetical protein